MKNKKIISIIIFIFGLILITSGIVISFTSDKNTNEEKQSNKNEQGNNNGTIVDDKKYSYKVDALYYGDITIGSKTINMITTTDEIKNSGYDRDTMHVSVYEDEDTEDKFTYSTMELDESYSIEFETYNSKYEDTGCKRCDVSMSNYIKLPKGVSYESTIEDVINAYGEPDSKDNNWHDQNYEYNDHIDGGNYGVLNAVQIVYRYNKDNVKMNLYLYFDQEDEILYRVVYDIDINTK